MSDSCRFYAQIKLISLRYSPFHCFFGVTTVTGIRGGGRGERRREGEKRMGKGEIKEKETKKKGKTLVVF